jgi:hypothetical protein
LALGAQSNVFEELVNRCNEGPAVAAGAPDNLAFLWLAKALRGDGGSAVPSLRDRLLVRTATELYQEQSGMT